MEKSRQILQKIKTSRSPLSVSRSRLPVSLRTPRDEKHYTLAKKKGITRPLLEEPRIREWRYWALIHNEFPYSAAFKVHHMLIPKRVVPRSDLNAEELRELDIIIDELGDTYDCRLVNYSNKQSIKDHYHMHFLVYKDNRKDMRI